MPEFVFNFSLSVFVFFCFVLHAPYTRHTYAIGTKTNERATKRNVCTIAMHKFLRAAM